MQRVSLDSIDEHFDKVEAWRLKQLVWLFPTMDIGQAEELARNSDRELLARAEALRNDGCPAVLAYRILR
jgi:hypothetical protein